MRSKLSPCTFLLPLGVLVSLTTGELKYYRDVMPESPEDITLKQLARYLEAQAHQQYGLYRSHLLSHSKPRIHKERFLELARQKERNILEALPNKPSILDGLQKKKLMHLNYQRHDAQSDLLNDFTGRNEQDRSYFDLDFMPDHYEEYANIRVPLLNNNLNSENVNIKTIERSYPIESAFMAREEGDIGRGMKEEPFSEFERKQMERDKERQIHNKNLLTEFNEPEAPFTFKFNKLGPEKNQFAVKPNDPRYYQNAAFSISTNDTLSQEVSTKRTEEEDKEKEVSNNKKQVSKQMFEVQKFPSNTFENANDDVLPEPQRRAEHDPLILPVDHKINNDIYFIAIVAGCSAAAMFALVLISLTWCRLQRGAKAAADIEYPAYGVTGPNKDISPSGDQRLAQSAQMYHFQHQKQQIIAMENRTAAARDPGSVSEAESDEENEEGDYTVYECPGLAPTGEMEVKNPLFHDDPTPATPAQINQRGDQM